MSQQLNTQHEPPRPGPEMTLYRLKAGERVTATILASLWGNWVHWNGQRSEACFREKKHCEGCRRGYPRRWKGYLHCLLSENRREVFLEVTPASADDLLGAVGGVKAPLRGVRCTISRGQGTKARLKVTLLPCHPTPDTLPQAKDPEATLRALWGYSEEMRAPGGPASIPLNEAI